MTRGYIGIGSNIEREKHISSGLRDLEQTFGGLMVSSVYESAPAGFSGEPFYNLAVGFDSNSDVLNVAKQLRAIEFAHGRPADSQKFTSRTLDLDLLLYGDLIIDNGQLKLPRDDIERYAFVLEPLAEIAPSTIHPVLKISLAELWRQMPKQNIQQTRLSFV